MTTRPVRERNTSQIFNLASQGIDNSGMEEISLLSLNTSDYTHISSLTANLIRNFQDKMVSIAIPSIRVNAFNSLIASEIKKVRKSGFTFAPESGSERLRRVINKVYDEEQFFKLIEKIFKEGWYLIKLYFMIGLPTETYEDLDSVITMVRKVLNIAKNLRGNRYQINLSISPFIPKPFTPFQWEPQISVEELNNRYRYIESNLKNRHIQFKRHNTYQSLYGAFGLKDTPVYAGLFLISLYLGVVGFFLSPIGAVLSRHYEREADFIAWELTGTAMPMSDALKRLAKDNLANLHPHPLYVWFYYSHPPLVERIDYLKALDDRSGERSYAHL